MSFYKANIAAVAAAALVLSSGVAFAQAGGPDTPTDAKSQGTMQNGSSTTGMSKSGAMKHMKHKSKTKKHM